MATSLHLICVIPSLIVTLNSAAMQIGADESEVYTAWPFDAQEAARRQDATAKKLGIPKELSLEIAPGMAMQFVLIPAGKFTMGSPSDEPGRSSNEGPQHEVIITKPFYMGCNKVTCEQYALEPLPKNELRNRPTQAGWESANDFCVFITDRTGQKIDLPTEAQWEYACRAGTQTPFNTGGTLTPDQANISRDEAGTHELKPVGSFRPNAFCLYDMHANAGEWCSDFYEEYKPSALKDPEGPYLRFGQHLSRGGYVGCQAKDCRSAWRHENNWYAAGFRLVITLPEKADLEPPVERARKLFDAVKSINPDDERAHNKTLTALIALGAAAKKAIVEATKDPMPIVRQMALTALSYIPEQTDIPLFLTELNYSTELGLKMIGAPAMPQLLAAAHDKNPELRRGILPILYEIDPKTAADPVLAIGKEDQDSLVRYVALETALKNGDSRALEPMITAVKADKARASEERCQAIRYLFKFGGKPGADFVVAEIEADPDALPVLLDYICYVRPGDARLVPLLIKGLDRERDNHCNGCSVRCLQALRSYPDDARARTALISGGAELLPDLRNETTPHLIQMLQGNDLLLASEAAQTLSQRREKNAVKPLLDLVDKPSFHMDLAMTALAEIGDDTAVPRLLELLKSGRYNPAVVSALGTFKVKDAVDPLIRIANSVSHYVYTCDTDAIKALGCIGDEKSVAALQRIIRTSVYQDKRKSAWVALHRTGTEEP